MSSVTVQKKVKGLLSLDMKKKKRKEADQVENAHDLRIAEGQPSAVSRPGVMHAAAAPCGSLQPLQAPPQGSGVIHWVVAFISWHSLA